MKLSVTWHLLLASALTLSSAPALAEGDAGAGKTKAIPCMGCHGIEGQSNTYPTYKVPRIGGQHAQYIVDALKAYQRGDRPHKTMQAQAADLSEQDMLDLAAYFSGAGEGAKK